MTDTSFKQIANFQEHLVADIQARSQEKKNTQEVLEKLAQAQKTNATAAEKKQFLADLEKNEKTKIYAQKASQIKTLKTEQATADTQTYQTEALTKIKQKMASNGVSVTELTSNQNSKAHWEKLTSGSFSEPTELVNIEMAITKQIFQTEAEKKIKSLTNQVQKVLKTGQAEQISQLKKELIEFITASNTYYAPKKTVAKNLLTQLENCSVSENQSSEKNLDKFSLPTKIFIGIGVSLVILVLVGIIAKTIKRRKKFKRK